MANDPAFDYYGNPPGAWARLRARWANMSSAYRYNTVLYGLAVIALTALVLEVALGESSPKFEVATQVAPVTTTTRPRPTSTSSTTIDPLATTTTLPGEVVDGAGAGASPIGPLTPTTRRRAAGGGGPAPGGGSGGGSNARPAGSPPTSDEPVNTNTTLPPITPPTNPATTNPPTSNTTSPTVPPTQPSITFPQDWCAIDPRIPGCS